MPNFAHRIFNEVPQYNHETAKQLIAYSDETYSFTCERNEAGDMINYQNSKGEKFAIAEDAK